MDSKTYWAKREEEALKHYIKDEREYDRQIKQIYQNMLDGCNEQINAFYGRYADKEGITLAEAKKRVKDLDIAKYERKAAKYVKEKDFSDKANEEMRLYNATMKINRLEMLKANIGLELIAGHDELEKFMADILKGRTEEELARQAGILGKTIRNNAKLAHTIPNASFHNATFSDRIWQYQDLMRDELSKQLQTGLIQGKNPRAIAKNLRKYWYGNDPATGGGAVYCMERLMRTELARVQTEAQKQSFERNGFTHYTFLANSNCCDICKSKDGKHFKVSKMMPGENAAPMHPHCRCSTAAYEDSDEYNAWLDYLDKGGTTAEWGKFKKKLDNSGKRVIMSNDKAATTDLQSDFSKIVDGQKKIGKDYARAIKTTYNKGTAQAKRVFNKYVKSDSVASTTSLGSYFDRTTRKIYLNASRDLDERIGIGTHYFHEHGHYIDFFAAGSKNGDFISMRNAKFGEKLRSDYTTYLQRIADNNGVSALRAEGMLESELQNKKKHGISDIVDGITNGKVIGCASHSVREPDYWKDPGRLEREAFANMYASCFDTEAAKYMSEYFPEAYKEFKKMIKEL